MGWLGWNEEQVLFSDINAIVIALEGYTKKLEIEKGIKINRAPTQVQTNPRQITVGGDKPSPLTPAAFDAMFGAGKSKSGVKARTAITRPRR